MMLTSLQTFLWMGGYALYVWFAFAMAFLVLSLNLVWSLRQQRKMKHAIRYWLQENDDYAPPS